MARSTIVAHWVVPMYVLGMNQPNYCMCMYDGLLTDGRRYKPARSIVCSTIVAHWVLVPMLAMCACMNVNALTFEQPLHCIPFYE